MELNEPRGGHVDAVEIELRPVTDAKLRGITEAVVCDGRRRNAASGVSVAGSRCVRVCIDIGEIESAEAVRNRRRAARRAFKSRDAGAGAMRAPQQWRTGRD